MKKSLGGTRSTGKLPLLTAQSFMETRILRFFFQVSKIKDLKIHETQPQNPKKGLLVIPGAGMKTAGYGNTILCSRFLSRHEQRVIASK